MDRQDLISQLHLDLNDPIQQIYEKLFCAAILPEGTDVVARVLKRYNEMKDILKEGR